MSNERILAVLPQQSETQRLVVVAKQREDCAPEMVLRQESRSDTGWFVQNEIATSPEQVAGLKLLLTSSQTRDLLHEETSRPTVIPIRRKRRRA